MDNEADDILMGTEFTEIFIPIKYTEKVMNLLNDIYIKKGLDSTGFYSRLSITLQTTDLFPRPTAMIRIHSTYLSFVQLKSIPCA